MKRLIFLSGLFTSLLIASNFMAVKLIEVFSITLPAAVICYPFCFTVGDIINETYGVKTTRSILISTFLLNAVALAFLAAAAILPASPFFTHNEGFNAIFMSAPRILLASFLAFLVSGFLNAYVFDKIKQKGRHLAVRSAVSTFLGVVVDSFLFITLAFSFTNGMGLTDIMLMVLWQTLAKLVLGVGLGTPLTLLVSKTLPKLPEKDLKYFSNQM